MSAGGGGGGQPPLLQGTPLWPPDLASLFFAANPSVTQVPQLQLVQLPPTSSDAMVVDLPPLAPQPQQFIIQYQPQQPQPQLQPVQQLQQLPQNYLVTTDHEQQQQYIANLLNVAELNMMNEQLLLHQVTQADQSLAMRPLLMPTAPVPAQNQQAPLGWLSLAVHPQPLPPAPSALPPQATVTQPTTATRGQPTATRGKPTATRGQPIATRGQPTATRGQPTATRGQPTATRGKRGTGKRGRPRRATISMTRPIPESAAGPSSASFAAAAPPLTPAFRSRLHTATTAMMMRRQQQHLDPDDEPCCSSSLPSTSSSSGQLHPLHPFSQHPLLPPPLLSLGRVRKTPSDTNTNTSSACSSSALSRHTSASSCSTHEGHDSTLLPIRRSMEATTDESLLDSAAGADACQADPEASGTAAAAPDASARAAPILDDPFGALPPTPPDFGQLPVDDYIPSHFHRGTVLQMADGSYKTVENLTTDDFVLFSPRSPHLCLQTSRIAMIERNSVIFRVTMALGKQHEKETMLEVRGEYPFFAIGKGWSSCDPEQTSSAYGLRTRELKVGDVCIALASSEGESKRTRDSLACIRQLSDVNDAVARENRLLAAYERFDERLPPAPPEELRRRRRRPSVGELPAADVEDRATRSGRASVPLQEQKEDEETEAPADLTAVVARLRQHSPASSPVRKRRRSIEYAI